MVTGATHAGDATAAQAQIDLTTAFNDAAGRSVGAVPVAGNLGGQTLTPGLYKSTSSLEISSGDLTLDAQGNEVVGRAISAETIQHHTKEWLVRWITMRVGGRVKQSPTGR